MVAGSMWLSRGWHVGAAALAPVRAALRGSRAATISVFVQHSKRCGQLPSLPCNYISPRVFGAADAPFSTRTFVPVRHRIHMATPLLHGTLADHKIQCREGLEMVFTPSKAMVCGHQPLPSTLRRSARCWWEPIHELLLEDAAVLRCRLALYAPCGASQRSGALVPTTHINSLPPTFDAPVMKIITVHSHPLTNVPFPGPHHTNHTSPSMPHSIGRAAAAPKHRNQRTHRLGQDHSH
jgi:hypothetical protein